LCARLADCAILLWLLKICCNLGVRRATYGRCPMFVSILIVRAVLSELYRRGVEQDAVLAGTSVNEERLANLAATVTRGEWDIIVDNALSITNDPALPFAISQRFPARTLQLLGDWVCATNTLREATQVFTRYAGLITDQLAWNLKED